MDDEIDTGTGTDTDQEPAAAPMELLRERALTGQRERPASRGAQRQTGRPPTQTRPDDPTAGGRIDQPRPGGSRTPPRPPDRPRPPRIPDIPDIGPEESSEPAVFETDADDALIDSGILGGGEAAADTFGDIERAFDEFGRR